jgi:hypothetical protein
MKTILITLTLAISTLAQAAPSNIGEVDPKECECQTCLIQNGICVQTQANSERYVKDTNTTPKPKNNKGKSGATAQ